MAKERDAAAKIAADSEDAAMSVCEKVDSGRTADQVRNEKSVSVAVSVAVFVSVRACVRVYTTCRIRGRDLLMRSESY